MQDKKNQKESVATVESREFIKEKIVNNLYDNANIFFKSLPKYVDQTVDMVKSYLKWIIFKNIVYLIYLNVQTLNDL